MHYGQILQSHALHFFHLSSPDLLFGFDSDVARRNIVGVAAEYPDIARGTDRPSWLLLSLSPCQPRRWLARN